MTREEAMRRVVEAARKWHYAWSQGLGTLAWIDATGQALAALDTLPADPPPAGETVEVAVWETALQHIVLAIPEGRTDKDGQRFLEWRRLGTMRLPLTVEKPA